MAKNSGSIAIPFLVTLLISLIVLGGVALYIYKDVTDTDDTLLTMDVSGTVVSEEDCFTLLCVLDTGEADVTRSYMIYRFNPIRKKNYCVAVPTNLEISVDGTATTVDACYLSSGMLNLEKALGATLEIEFDRYLKFGSDAFERLCSILGGVECKVPFRVKGITTSDSAQTLNGSQIQAYFTSDKFPGGETQRCLTIAQTVSEMFNQSDAVRLNESIDSSFSAIVELAETDISALDYRNRKHALQYMLDYAPTAARYLIMPGAEENGRYILDTNFLISIKESF